MRSRASFSASRISGGERSIAASISSAWTRRPLRLQIMTVEAPRIGEQRRVAAGRAHPPMMARTVCIDVVARPRAFAESSAAKRCSKSASAAFEPQRPSSLAQQVSRRVRRRPGGPEIGQLRFQALHRKPDRGAAGEVEHDIAGRLVARLEADGEEVQHGVAGRRGRSPTTAPSRRARNAAPSGGAGSRASARSRSAAASQTKRFIGNDEALLARHPAHVLDLQDGVLAHARRGWRGLPRRARPGARGRRPAAADPASGMRDRGRASPRQGQGRAARRLSRAGARFPRRRPRASPPAARSRGRGGRRG